MPPHCSFGGWRYRLSLASSSPASSSALAALEVLRAAANLGRVEIEAGCHGDSCSLRSLGVRQHTGATVVAIDRAGSLQPSPSPDLELQAGDVLLVYGNGEQIAATRELVASNPSR